MSYVQATGGFFDDIETAAKRSFDAAKGIVPRSDAFNQKMAELEAARQNFNAAWDIDIGTEVPAVFVQDLLLRLLNDVVIPMTNFNVREIAQKVMLQSTRTKLAQAFGSAEFMWSSKLLPVLADATSTLHGSTDPAITVSIPSDFRQRVMGLIDFAKLGYETTSEIEEGRTFGEVPELAAFVIMLDDAATMISRVKESVLSLGEKIYKPIGDTIKILELMFKLSVAAGGIYVLYQLFKPKQQQKNPGRRHRRRKRWRR